MVGSTHAHPTPNLDWHSHPQSQLSVLDPAEMAQLDDQLKEVKAALDERRKELKSLQSGMSLENPRADAENSLPSSPSRRRRSSARRYAL